MLNVLNTSSKSIVLSSIIALLIAAPGTGAFGASEDSRGCRDLQSDVTAIRVSLGLLDGKVDQCNSDLTLVRGELQWIHEALMAQAQANSALQLQVEADETSCATGAVQCASALMPASLNQNPVELKLFVLRDQVAVTNLAISNFEMTTAFSPEGGPDVTACAASETGCGSPAFFINRGNGAYQLWVHPPANPWVSGTYTLLLRVTDADGRIARKLVNVSIAADAGLPRVIPPIANPPGNGMEQNRNSVNAVN
jgi:hypothetical protein